MIGVHAPDFGYRVAIAELPLRTRLVDRVDGAIAVVQGGSRWIEEALTAAFSGACAIVVADPEFVSSADLGRLQDAARVPVIIERPLVRTDVGADVTASRRGPSGAEVPRLVVVDAASRPMRRALTTRDALGWARILSGAFATVTDADGALALLDAGATAVTVTVVTHQRPGAGWIKGRALGEITTEIEVDGRNSSVVTSTAAGRLRAPSRFESSERLALRRAVESLADGRHSDDLAELLHDTRLAEDILANRS